MVQEKMEGRKEIWFIETVKRIFVGCFNIVRESVFVPICSVLF